jgi:hypothetical protein
MASGYSSPSSPTGNNKEKDSCQDLLGLQRDRGKVDLPLDRFAWGKRKKRERERGMGARVCRPKFK